MTTELWLSAADAQALAAKSRSRMWLTLGLSGASGALSFIGMWLRYSGAADSSVPLPGMNHWAGELSWAVTLAGALIVFASLIRSVLMQHLQWAVVISLVLHLLLCFSMHSMGINVPLTESIQAEEISGRPLEELTLPDHGGLKEPDSAWEQPADVATPEMPTELERQQAQAVEAQRPEDIAPERPVEVVKLDTPERQEAIKLAQDQKAQLERQQREQELKVPQAVAQPEVKTESQKQVEVEVSIEQAKQTNAALNAQRQQMEVASKSPQVEAAKVEAQRSEAKPQQNDPNSKLTPRAATTAAAAATTTESVDVASASEAKQLAAQEQRTELARQQAAASGSAGAAGGNPAATNAPTSAGAPSVSGSTVSRAAGVGTPSIGAPTSGGTGAIARSTGREATASGAPVQTVAVASASGVGAPRVGESAASGAGTRGTAASVPLGSASAAGAAVGVSSPNSGAAVRGTGGIARQGTGNGQPQLGAVGTSGLAAGVPGTSGSGTGRATGAVGAQAGPVSVASAGSGGAGQGGGVLGSGPAGTAIGRQATGLPGSSNGNSSGVGGGTGPGTSTAPSSGSGLGSGVGKANTGTGLASRGTEPTARLGADTGISGGTGTGLSTARSGADAKLPIGADAAEQSGTLVFSGPQAQAAASGALKGPQLASVPRRSAGLPGSSGISAGTGAVPSTGATVGQPTRIAGGPARSGVGDDRPLLASAEQVAGLIKQSVPGIGITPEAKISASLSLRKTDARREAAKSLGGSTASEEAVERGLEWLVKHQQADGRWSIHEFPCRDHQCSGHGSMHSDTAATGLALLAFLGAGYTHQSGVHQEAVAKGLKWHIQHQKTDGDLFADEAEFVWFYSHGMAAIALCEAYGMTKDSELRAPAQKALDFIVASQHPQFGGWRYRPRFESDTSVSGWQLMALKSGEMGGLKVAPSAYTGVAKWLDSVESKIAPGQFTYHPSRPASPAMTAEGLLMRQYLGVKRTDTRLIAGADFLKGRLPDLNERDAYFWYYGTQVMFHMQGEYWDAWNTRLRDTLVTSQMKDGGSSGSWNPDRPTPEKWAAAGGRHYLTCLNLLMLEVYYRHLPLYVELGK